MKKTILLIAAFTFALNICKSQETEPSFHDRFQLGLKVGANYSNVYDAVGEEFNADFRFGIVTGAFITIPIFKHIGIQTEFLFSQKGFQATGKLLGNIYKFTRTTSFIDVPLFLSLRPNDLVTFQIGPQYSFLLRQKDVFSDATSSIEQVEKFKNDNIRKNILCFIGGADFNLSHLVLGLRFGWDILNNNGDGTSITPRYKNVWYQATLGFRFL